ncbi:MAG: TMEM165/GDT1 family protein [Kiritimatiellae bacterium]|nr:TMEM165/GDT1 family protein [Kiritimatiellia bacterium]
MDYRLFLSTFLLIFLAELGDKTQLAALTRTAAADGSKWTVFLAASAALVLSTLIAVLIGEGLSKLIAPRTIKITAGILFVLFGLLILKGVFMPATASAEAITPAPLARVVLKLAAEFEHAAAADYRALAERTSDPALAELFRALEQEEAAHLAHIEQADMDHGETKMAEAVADVDADRDRLAHDVAEALDVELSHAIEHEQATAEFYAGLAGTTPIAALKQTFLALAREEESHVARLKAYADRS